MYNIATLVVSVIAVVINIMGFVWIKNLEDISCKCSENWMRDYIKYFLIAYFVINTINLTLSLYINSIKNKEAVFMSILKNPLYMLWSGLVMLYSVFAFINIFVVITYIQKLKEVNCECSEDVKREIYWYYNIIIISVVALFILLSLIELLMSPFTFRKFGKK